MNAWEDQDRVGEGLRGLETVGKVVRVEDRRQSKQGWKVRQKASVHSLGCGWRQLGACQPRA